MKFDFKYVLIIQTRDSRETVIILCSLSYSKNATKKCQIPRGYIRHKFIIGKNQK